MATPLPDHEPIAARGLAEETAMDTFTVQLPRWLMVRLAAHNPLLRTSDRIEAIVLVLAVTVSVLVAPIAGALGTAVHDSHRQIYAEQLQTRHAVTATTVIDDNAAQPDSPTNTITVQARWSTATAEHTGAIKAKPSVTTGDPVQIWVDNSGSPVDAPTPTTQAAAEAVGAAVALWLGVAGAAASLFAGTRVVLDRVRDTGWQHDIDTTSTT